MLSFYTDSKCAKVDATMHSINYTHSAETNDGLHDFNCDGTVDYTATNIYAGSCTTPFIPVITTYGVVNLCFGAKNGSYHGHHYNVFQKSQCNATYGTVHTWVSGASHYNQSLGCRADYTSDPNVSYVKPTCSYYYTFSSIPIYAEISDCVYDGESQFPQMETNIDTIPSNQPVKAVYTFEFGLSPDTVDDMANTSYSFCDITYLSYFEELFTGAEINVTWQCTKDKFNKELVQLSSVDVQVTVAVFSLTYFNGTVKSCNNYQLESLLHELLHAYPYSIDYVVCSTRVITTTTTATPTTTITKAKSVGHMEAINFVVLMICFVMSMYIL